jgi:hypothetical protein
MEGLIRDHKEYERKPKVTSIESVGWGSSSLSMGALGRSIEPDIQRSTMGAHRSIDQ